MRLRLGPSIRTGRRPLRLADRERAETSLYQGRINDGNRTETPRAHARGARGRGGDRHRLAAGEGPLDAQQPPPPGQSCVQVGGSQFKCESPGNVQLNDAPSVTNNPY